MLGNDAPQVTIATSNAGGWAADALVNSGALSRTSTRKLLQVSRGYLFLLVQNL